MEFTEVELKILLFYDKLYKIFIPKDRILLLLEVIALHIEKIPEFKAIKF